MPLPDTILTQSHQRAPKGIVYGPRKMWPRELYPTRGHAHSASLTVFPTPAGIKVVARSPTVTAAKNNQVRSGQPNWSNSLLFHEASNCHICPVRLAGRYNRLLAHERFCTGGAGIGTAGAGSAGEGARSGAFGLDGAWESGNGTSLISSPFLPACLSSAGFGLMVPGPLPLPFLVVMEVAWAHGAGAQVTGTQQVTGAQRNASRRGRQVLGLQVRVCCLRRNWKVLAGG
jgi:hypothetical protein